MDWTTSFGPLWHYLSTIPVCSEPCPSKGQLYNPHIYYEQQSLSEKYFIISLLSFHQLLSSFTCFLSLQILKHKKKSQQTPPPSKKPKPKPNPSIFSNVSLTWIINTYDNDSIVFILRRGRIVCFPLYIFEIHVVNKWFFFF